MVSFEFSSLELVFRKMNRYLKIHISMGRVKNSGTELYFWMQLKICNGSNESVTCGPNMNTWNLFWFRFWWKQNNGAMLVFDLLVCYLAVCFMARQQCWSHVVNMTEITLIWRMKQGMKKFNAPLLSTCQLFLGEQWQSLGFSMPHREAMLIDII